MKISNVLTIVFLGMVVLLSSCTEDSNIAPPLPELPKPEAPPLDLINNIVWSPAFSFGSGGYPRMAEGADGTLFLGMDTGDGIKISESFDNGVTFSNEVIAVPNPPIANEYVGNVFPLVLPNGDILVAYRHLNDVNKYDNAGGDGVEFFNIDISVSKDGGKTWNYLSSPLNDPRSPIGGGEEVDQSEGAWEPFMYYDEASGEVWCLYSRQNEQRDSHPLWLTMKRSTDGGATWGAEEVVVGTGQFGDMGSAGMNSLVKTQSGEIIVVFETQDKINNNWFAIGMVTSSDNGNTWSEISSVYSYPTTSSIYGAGAPFIAMLEDGKLIVTFQFGAGDVDTQFGYVMSDDDGETWTSAYRMWIGEKSLWNTVFVSSKNMIYALSSGAKYKIGSVSTDNKISNSFYLFAKSSNSQVVDANWPWPAENNNVHTWGVAPGAEQVLWNIRDNGDGYFWLQPVSSSKYGQDPGKCLDIDGDGRNIHLWDFLGADNQLWMVEPATTDGYYKVVSKLGNVVLTIENDEVRNDANVIAIGDTEAIGQQFISVPYVGDGDPFAEWIANKN